MPLRSSEAHYRDLQRLTALTVSAGRRAWSRLDLSDLDGSFRDVVGPQLLTTLTVAQSTAAARAGEYVSQALDEQGLQDAPQGSLRPRSLSGVASDGRPLTGLLRAPLTDVKGYVAAGSPTPVEDARSALDRILWTQVVDASRAAASVAMTARPNVQGYVRVVNLPACGRCMVLAGRFYKTSEAFLRHPQCDCTNEPTNDRGATTDPLDGFWRMTPAEQDKAFTKAGAQAIRDGADISRVVNARRGMSRAQSGRIRRDALGAYSTREGLSRRARLPGQRDVGYRLMPESIYELASDRDEAIRLLRRNGYLT